MAHGAFRLFHTFSNESFAATPGTTTNLMDYNQGTVLKKYQWDFIHNPESVNGLLLEDEESEYTNTAYVQKVLQQLRCAYLAKMTSIESLEKKGIFVGTLSDLGIIRLTISEKPVVLKRGTAIQGLSGGLQGKVIQAIDYGGLKLEYYGEKAGADNVQNYIFPANADAARAETKKVLEPLYDKSHFSNDEIESIRAIANCGAQYITAKQKVSIISIIVKDHSLLTEQYEDLILDLLETFEGDHAAYAQQVIQELSGKRDLMRRLFYGMDNSKTVFAKEDNANRFIQVIYSLWKETTYASRENYRYVEEVLVQDKSASPYCLAYQGDQLFPNLSYESPTLLDSKIRIPVSFTASNGEKKSFLDYDYFQPVFLLKERNKQVTYLASDIPAIMFASIIETDNFDRLINKTSLGADVILTFTGIGNATKLRHLTRAQKIGRIILGGMEFGTSALDILLNYTDICTDEEFCKVLQTYNFYIQMSMLGGEAVSALYRKGLQDAKLSAQAAYERSRPRIVARYGENSDKVKLLDEHFSGSVSIFSPMRGVYSEATKMLTLELSDLEHIVEAVPTGVAANSKVVATIKIGENEFKLPGQGITAEMFEGSDKLPKCACRKVIVLWRVLPSTQPAILKLI